MNRVTRGIVFWVLLLLTALPSIIQGQDKVLRKWSKCLYSTNTSVGTAGTGSGTLMVDHKLYKLPDASSDSDVVIDWRARATVTGVNKASLGGHISARDNVTPIPVLLCEGDDCTYDDAGKLFASGRVNPSYGGKFVNRLEGGYISLDFNDTTAGTGIFTLSQPCAIRCYDEAGKLLSNCSLYRW
jgi:hypothetical protein